MAMLKMRWGVVLVVTKHGGNFIKIKPPPCGDCIYIKPSLSHCRDYIKIDIVLVIALRSRSTSISILRLTEG
eukprot:10301065-Ditylum_brightwellii.AAC.1